MTVKYTRHFPVSSVYSSPWTGNLFYAVNNWLLAIVILQENPDDTFTILGGLLEIFYISLILKDFYNLKFYFRGMDIDLFVTRTDCVSNFCEHICYRIAYCHTLYSLLPA